MAKNHSQYVLGQAGADIGTCRTCKREKMILYPPGVCGQCKLQHNHERLQEEQGRLVWNPNLDRTRELEGQ